MPLSSISSAGEFPCLFAIGQDVSPIIGSCLTVCLRNTVADLYLTPLPNSKSIEREKPHGEIRQCRVLISSNFSEITGDRAVKSATLAELRRADTDAAAIAQFVNLIQDVDDIEAHEH